MLFGTFDGLHSGHLNFFTQARRLTKDNPFLIISVARDKNVFKIKGAWPQFSEKERVELVRNTRLADKVVLGGLKSYLPHIIKNNPEIIALGYDQRAYVKNLRKDLKNKGLKIQIRRLKAYKPNIFKNSLLRKNIKI